MMTLNVRFVWLLLSIASSALTVCGLPARCSDCPVLPNAGYSSDSVLYYNADSTIRFGATIRLPATSGRCGAVIIVSGTGKQDRNGTMAGHKMFAAIADYLAKAGIAVLTVDDRGTGLTTGNYEASTTADFAKDVMSAVDYLKSRKEVDPGKIGLIGHSEGGAVISIVASQSRDIAFLVSLAGLCMPGCESLIKQNVDLINAADMPDVTRKRYIGAITVMITTAHQYAGSDSLEAKLRSAYEEWQKSDAEYVKRLDIKNDHFFFPLETYLRQATTPWYRYLIQYDPKKYVTRISAPIFAINGDKDLMVNYKINLDNWASYPLAAGNHRVTTLVLKQVNHLFQHCSTCSATEYPDLNETFAPEALPLIADWVNKQLK